MIGTPGWKVEESLINKARIALTLLKEESTQTPMPAPSTQKEYETLYFEYPEASMSGKKSLSQKLSKEEKDKIEQETGIRPILPKPDLKSAPNMLVAVNMQEEEISRQIIDQLQRVAQETFESPESCTSKGDVAGHLSVAAKALRPLSYAQLKQVESKLESEIQSKPQNQRQIIRNLFYDVVSMIGTNPAIMFVKERVKDVSRVSYSQAVTMIQAALNSVRTPTQELLQELIQLVKEDLKPLAHDRSQVYSVALIQMSNLLHKACIHPTHRNLFPVRIYGGFCQRDSAPVQQYIQFLKQELESQQSQQIRLNVITAIGKLGHIKSVQILSEIISNQRYNEIVRSLAVYSMKRAAKLEPSHVRPILLSIIDNPADHSQVRMAAIAVLPWTQPSTTDLQKVAVRTWLEPSKEVAAFVYSTFKSLKNSQIPELKLVSQKVQPLMTLVKPFYFGMHYSHNYHSGQFVKYLNFVVNQEFSWIKSPISIIPTRHSESATVYGSSVTVNGWSWTTYTQGMDKWVDSIMYFNRRNAMTSQSVQEQLQKLTQSLNIVSRQQGTPEVFQQFRMFDMEHSVYMNDETVLSMLSKLAEELEQNSITDERSFEFTKAIKAMEVEALGPSEIGFPIYVERSIPMVLSAKGMVKLDIEEEETYKIPKMIQGKIVPVVNIKMEANIGVISPFTNELIGGGFEAALHYAAPLEMSVRRQSSQMVVDIKVPQEVRREIEAIHVFITPYTVRKDLKKIEPISKSANLQPIKSGQTLKQHTYNLLPSLEIDARLQTVSDNKFTDLFSYWEKIRQHGVASLVNSFFLPSSLRMSSSKIIFNPQQSRTKEVSLTFGLGKE